MLARSALLDAPTVTSGPLSDRALQIAATLSDQSISARFLGAVVRLVDIVVTMLIGIGIYAIYVAPIDGIVGLYALPLVLCSAVTVILVHAADGYSVPSFRTHLAQMGRVWISWTLVFAVFAVAAFLSKTGNEFSRGFILAWYGAGLIYFAATRLTLSTLVRRWTRQRRLERRAVIVGGGKEAAELIAALSAQPDNDIRICGVFDDRGDDRSPAIVGGFPKIGTVSELVGFGRIARIDMLIVTLPITAENRLLSILKQLWVLPVDVRLSAHSNKLRFRPRAYSYVGNVPFLDIFDKPIADWDSFTKRAFDVVCSSILLLLLSPIMLLTALAIRLDSRGPALFKQKRFGFNNEVIEVLKFRSMRHEDADPEARVVVTRDDPRVTRVGRLVRKSSIDELPQLFNVLRGDLSLVGPRPHAVNAHTDDRLWNDVVDGYFARHRVKPGVTGWAQVNGWRGEVDTPEKIHRRVEHDLYYIENWSVLFDVYILALTPFRMFSTENAY